MVNNSLHNKLMKNKDILICREFYTNLNGKQIIRYDIILFFLHIMAQLLKESDYRKKQPK